MRKKAPAPPRKAPARPERTLASVVGPRTYAVWVDMPWE